jgi:aminoglycoside phosphotransferase (APT) family kinase protein
MPARPQTPASAPGESVSSGELPENPTAQLTWVLDESGEFPDLPPTHELAPDQVVSLRGGVDAATYLVRCPQRDVVVKLSTEGLEAEARALRAWRPYTERVPEVVGLGTVPPIGESSVKYLILAAMKNDAGDVVETAADFLRRSPQSAGELGCALGSELYRMHQAVDHEGFGNFADSPGSERTYRSWTAYLEDFFALHTDFLRQVSIDDDRIQAVRAFIRACPYVREGRFLHGDVTIRNVGVHSYHPLTVGLFDPNPLSGDPSWDIAPMMNNAAFNELRYRRTGTLPDTLELDRDLVSGFWECYNGEIAEESLMTAQLVQSILQAEHRHDRLERGHTEEIDVNVTHEFIHGLVNRIAA